MTILLGLTSLYPWTSFAASHHFCFKMLTNTYISTELTTKKPYKNQQQRQVTCWYSANKSRYMPPSFVRASDKNRPNTHFRDHSLGLVGNGNRYGFAGWLHVMIFQVKPNDIHSLKPTLALKNVDWKTMVSFLAPDMFHVLLLFGWQQDSHKRRPNNSYW